MNADEQDPVVSKKEVKELVAFGRKCAREAFPNPTREGCPDRARLRAMALREPSLTLADLPITHVVHCSPCFQDYLHFRRSSVFARGFQFAVVSLTVLAVLATAVLLVIGRLGAPARSTLSKQAAPRAEPSPGVAAPQTVAPAIPIKMKIDLAAFSPTRGDEEHTARKMIRLPQRHLRITFEMPLGMEAGEYLLRLKDSSGTVYSDTRAPGYIVDGKTTVNSVFDLSSAPRGKATLMIRPPGLSWRRFPTIIE